MALGASFKLPMTGSAPRPGSGLRSVYALGLLRRGERVLRSGPAGVSV